MLIACPGIAYNARCKQHGVPGLLCGQGFFFFFLFRSLRLDKTDLFFSPAAVPFLVVDALSFLPVDIGGEGWHDPTVKKNV